jgi:hypothetical protein
MVLSRLVGEGLDLVPIQAGVELEPGEVEVSGGPRLVAARALERLDLIRRQLEPAQQAGARRILA